MGSTPMRELRIPQNDMVDIQREGELQEKLEKAGFDPNKKVIAYFDLTDLEFVYKQDLN